MTRKTRPPGNRPALYVAGPTVVCSGRWALPRLGELESGLAAADWPETPAVDFDMTAVTAMDTAGATLLRKTVLGLEGRGRAVSVRGLSREAQALFDLVCKVYRASDEVPRPPRPGILEEVGQQAVKRVEQDLNFLAFIGELGTVIARTLRSPSRLRWRVIMHGLGEAGYKALLIVGLLSFLLGVVIAYQGGVQLRQYGANIYIADLVGLSMLRELAPLITAIIVAGRTGSAYTAEIGTMTITEEVDALRAIGIAPMELLVLPKLLALVVALPLLTVYADITGVLGGMVMANGMLGIGPVTFLDRFETAVSLQAYLIGVGKAPVFAAIIAAVGCFQGFQVRGSAESVGRQTTVSVVQAIFLVIVVDAAFSVVFSWLGI